MSPLSKATRNHIADVQRKRANDLKKLRDAKRKKNPTFMDKFKKGFKKEEQEQEVDELNKSTMARYTRAAARDINHQGIKGNLNKIKKRVSGIDKATNKLAMRKEDVELDEALNKDWIKAVNDLSKKMGASVAKSSKGGIIPFASRNGKTTNIGYTDSKGKRNVVFSTDKSLSKKEEDKMLSDIRKKFAKEEVEITEAKSKAGDALMAYAKKSGGIDKRDMMTIAGKLQNYAATGNPSNKMDIAKKLKSMDTDPRDKVVEILMANDPAMGRAIMQKAGIKLREETQMDEQKLDELSPMTLRKYRAKASRDQAGGNPMTRDPKRFDKRSKGIARANKKISSREPNPFELYTTHPDGQPMPGWKAASKELEKAVKSGNKSKVQQLQKKYAHLGARDTEANQAIRQMMGESVEVNEAIRDRKSYEAGQKAAQLGKKYDTNPYPKGSQSHLDWSKGHNSARSAKIDRRNEEVEHIEEATWYKVDVEGMPTVFMDGSPSEIKMKLRKTLKKPDMIKSVERITPADMKKHFRAKAMGNDDGPGDDDGPGIDEAISKFSDKQIKMAYGILNDPRWKGGNMTAIVRKIEGIARGLSSHPGVRAAIKRTNEEYDNLVARYMLDEANDNDQESSMAEKQLEFIEYAAEEIDEWLEDNDMPEWFQNKLTKAFSLMQDLHAYAEGETGDDDEEGDDDKEKKESVQESDAAYARALEKEREGRLTSGDRDKLAKIRAMLSKEKRAELRRDAKK